MPFLIKICGLNSLAAVDAALEAQADLLGFVFVPKSPRYIAPEQAILLADRVHGKAVALFSDTPSDVRQAAIKALQPAWIQFHGQESVEDIRRQRESFSGKIIRALGIGSEADLPALDQWRDHVDLLLLDARPPAGASRTGGHGRTFDWSVLEKLDHDTAFMLSGGLAPDTVAQAIARVRPRGVDVSSGVERAPGQKDPDRILAFVRAAREAAAQAGL